MTSIWHLDLMMRCLRVILVQVKHENWLDPQISLSLKKIKILIGPTCHFFLFLPHIVPSLFLPGHHCCWREACHRRRLARLSQCSRNVKTDTLRAPRACNAPRTSAPQRGAAARRPTPLCRPPTPSVLTVPAAVLPPASAALSSGKPRRRAEPPSGSRRLTLA